MNGLERRAATLRAFLELDPEGQGVRLVDVAERVAQDDASFMRRYNFSTKVLKFVGIERLDGALGAAYLGRMYAPAKHFERNGIIDADWQEQDGGYPRQRICRYLGLVGLDRPFDAGIDK